MEPSRDMLTRPPTSPLGNAPLTLYRGLGEPWEATSVMHGSVASRWQEAVGNLVSVPGGWDK